MKHQPNERMEYVFIYIVGSLHAGLHFTVGIIWENVDLPKGSNTLLSLPYFGGYLTLLGVALLLIFIYLFLSLKKQPDIPIHIRRFCLTLSIIITVGSLVLFVVMCIRTNDYRLQKDQITRRAYYGAVLMTVVDILATIFFMPSYIYLTICSYKRVQSMKMPTQNQENNQPNNSPVTDRQLYIPQRASTDSAQNQNEQPQHPLSTQPPQQVITINDNIQMNQSLQLKRASCSQPQTEACQMQTNGQNIQIRG